MEKKLLSVVLTISLIVSSAGCGNKEADKTAVNTGFRFAETEGTEVGTVDIIETDSMGKAEMETAYDAGDYEEQKDIFVYKNIGSGDGTQIDFADEEHFDGPFTLSDSIEIYSYFFTYAGYTKPNIEVDSVGRIGEWVFVPFSESGFLVKAEDFDKVAVLEEKGETDLAGNNTAVELESAIEVKESEVSAQAESNIGSNKEAIPTSKAVPQAEEAVPAITTYSEEEVISIFRNILESNGIQWYPDSDEYAQWPEAGPSGGMGWGIENISMTDPYGDAAKTVEGFQFGGWQYYYIENQGSSNGYVHLKLYSG